MSRRSATSPAVRRLIAGVLLTALLPAGPAPVRAQDVMLGAIHKQAGIGCEACHVETPPVAPDSFICSNCHGSAAELAAKAPTSGPNPHASPHLPVGESQPCTECHHVHRASEVTCATCHKTFQFRFRHRVTGGN